MRVSHLVVIALRFLAVSAAVWVILGLTNHPALLFEPNQRWQVQATTVGLLLLRLGLALLIWIGAGQLAQKIVGRDREWNPLLLTKPELYEVAFVVLGASSLFTVIPYMAFELSSIHELHRQEASPQQVTALAHMNGYLTGHLLTLGLGLFLILGHRKLARLVTESESAPPPSA